VDSFIIDLSQISSDVEYAEKVPAVYTFSVSYDPIATTTLSTYLPTFYCLPLLNADQASNIHIANGNAVVAIVDDAVLTTHEDLAANINSVNTGSDVADGDPNPNPMLVQGEAYRASHGTRVAGIAGAVTNNSVGIASIGWNNRLMCVKASSDNPQTLGHLTNPFGGVLWAAFHGAHVINMSWGSYAPSITEYTVITLAKSQNVVLVAAVGNDMTTVPTYPAAYGEGTTGQPWEVIDKKLVVAVAGLDQTNNIGVWNENIGAAVYALGSNYGYWVDIAAYCVGITSTKAASTAGAPPFGGIAINNQYGIGNGTSFAAPMVSGIAGIMRSYKPSKTANEIIDCLINTANPDIYGSSHPSNQLGKLGSGRADAAAALRCLSSNCTVNPIAIIVPSSPSLCASTTLTLTANQGATTYSWNTGATTQSIIVNTAGTYSVVASYTAGTGCSATASITISPLPTLTLSVMTNTSICPGASVNLISAAGSYSSIIWHPGGMITNSIVANLLGTNVFSATANPFCGGVTATISINTPGLVSPPFGLLVPYSVLGPTISSAYSSLILGNSGALHSQYRCYSEWFRFF